MESPFWHTVGIVGVIGFVASIVLALVGRRLFVSTDGDKVRRGADILSSLGGAANARSAQKELQKRKMK